MLKLHKNIHMEFVFIIRSVFIAFSTLWFSSALISQWYVFLS